MTAKIIPFPTRRGMEAAHLGDMLRDIVPLVVRDPELAMLCTMADHLISSYDDGLCDSFLSRIAAWEAENKRG